MSTLRDERIDVGATARSEMNVAKLIAAAGRAQFENLRHAAFSLAKVMKASIVKSKTPSDVGSPPATRGLGGKNLRGAIFTDATMESAVIGPRHSFVGDVGEAHEFGINRKGDEFDERPFAFPALEASTDRFHRDWHGRIGE
jgi:hypothetical protein